MTMPVLAPVADQVYTDLQPKLAPTDDQHEHAFAWLVAAVTWATDLADTIVGAGGAPLAVLYDPDACPPEALPFCAGAHGVTLPQPLRLDDPAWVAAARALIRDRPARRRGTLAALTAAVLAVLPPRAYLRIARRTDPDHPGEDRPYDLTILTRTADGADPTTVLAAAEPHRPRGHVFHHRTADGATWLDLEGVSWADLDGTSWADLTEGNLP